MTLGRRPRNTDRRTFLKSAGAAAGTAVVAGFPAVLRAQAPTVKIGALHCVTGPLAEPGQACRLGAQMAADAVNAAGGIKSLGGARIELILGDTQTKADVARAEAERLINAGAQVLMGTFNSGDTAAVVPVAQQRRMPFLVDISAADPITANVAKSVRDGQQKVQYVYRNFPTGTLFGQRAVQYFTEIFKEAGISPKRVVVMHANDLFGQNQARGFQAAHRPRIRRGRSSKSSRGPSRRRISRRRSRAPRPPSPTSLPPSPGRPAPSSSCRRSPNSVSTSWASWARAAPASTKRGRSPR